jgi:acyl-coenzyme A synthetase/AMP-(fatty) acid ligase
MEKPIKIVYYSEVIDNYGRTESSKQGHIIHEILNDPSLWSDDMTFEGENNQIYFIDDLIGKEVEVENMGIFTVPED